MSPQTRTALDYFKVAAVIFGAGGLVATNAIQHERFTAAEVTLARTDTTILDSLASFRRAGARQDSLNRVVIEATGIYRCLHSTDDELKQLRLLRWCNEQVGR